MSAPQSNPAAPLAAAQEWLAKGEYHKALHALEGVPPEREALKIKANILARLGQTDDAIKCHETILEHARHDPSVLIDFAAFLMGVSEFERAIGMYDRAIRLDASAAAVHRDRALALRLGSRTEEALAGYDRALALDSSDGETWAAKADLLIDLHLFREALDCLERSAAAPNQSLDPFGWTSRASTMSRVGGYDEAIYCYDRVLAQSPTDVTALMGKASVLRNKGDIDGALDCYDGVIQSHPKDTKALAEKGNILTDRRQFAEAIQCYQVALEHDPSKLYSWLNLAYCRIETEQYSQALADYERATTLDPKSASAWEGRGHCLYVLGRFDEAVQSWQEALKFDSGLMWPNNNIGWVLADVHHKYEEALEWYDRAILLLGPTEVQPVINKARALFALKRVSEAHALLEGVLARGSENPGAALALAVVYSETFNDASKALELCQKAEVRGESTPILQLSIAEMLIRLGRREEGRNRASAILHNEGRPQLQAVAAFLVYASHALDGHFEAADRCFNDFAERVAAQARTSQSARLEVNWTYDGFADMLLNSSVSIATKFALLAAIDLQGGRLNSPALAKLQPSLPLIRVPSPAGAGAAPEPV
jgi:tetratricopeptide (TPR) repeat protein